MPDKEVNIEEMKLRVPGLNKMEAEEIGKEVMRHVAENIPASKQSRRIDNLELKVMIPEGVSGSSMANIISKLILKVLL